jgi:hypothetical protein
MRLIGRFSPSPRATTPPRRPTSAAPTRLPLGPYGWSAQCLDVDLLTRHQIGEVDVLVFDLEMNACLNEISRRLEVDDVTANRLWEGLSDVYELMASQCLPRR